MSDQILRDHLLELLRGGSAHLGLDEAIEGLPADLRGTKHQELPRGVRQLRVLRSAEIRRQSLYRLVEAEMGAAAAQQLHQVIAQDLVAHDAINPLQAC